MTADHFIETELRSANGKPPTVPNPVPGWCTREKARVIVSMVRKFKPMVLVEIGVFGGSSLFPMALAMQEIGHGRICYGIDPWTREAALEGDVGEEHRKWWTDAVDLEAIYRGFLRRIVELNLGNTLRVMRKRGDQVNRLFPRASIPMIHLDSNHSEQVSCRDVTIWTEKLSPGGIWVMDDTDWPSMQRAVAMVDQMGFDLLVNGGTYRVYRSKVQ